jgi:ABC-type lipoprotein release transport system permease subunit
MLVLGTTRNMNVMAVLTLFIAILVAILVVVMNVMNVFHHSKVLLGRLVAKAD